MNGWRMIWESLFDDEPDAAVAASMDEIERYCAPNIDDPFLIIAMFQHRNGQILDLSLRDWLQHHGEAVRAYLRDANAGAMKLYVSAGKAATSVRELEALSSQVVERAHRASGTLERAEKQLGRKVAYDHSVLRAIQEHMSWTRPALLVLLAMALIASTMVNGFLAKRAFAERPGEMLWSQLSDAERRDLPSFITSGALSEVMNCKVPGFKVKAGRCLPASVDMKDGTEGWSIPAEVAARAARPWSAEKR